MSAGNGVFLGIMTVTVAVMVLLCCGLIGVIAMLGMAGEEYADVLTVVSWGSLLVILVISEVTSILQILNYLFILLASVLSSVILYKVYQVFAKDHAVWMLLLSLFVPYASSVILLVLALSEKSTVKKEPLHDESENSTCTQEKNVI